MKVFISWSGATSKAVALALHKWLPIVLQYVEPWMSERDIAAGERWAAEVATRLEESSFGILCLAPDNLNAPWLLFEAGAISKVMAIASVCPYLLGVDFRDVSGPLGQFQAKKAEKAPTLELVEAINQKAPKPLEQLRLHQTFDALWPTLEQELAGIPVQTGPRLAASPPRTDSEVLDTLVQAVRAFERQLNNIDSRLRGVQAELATGIITPLSEEIPAYPLEIGSPRRRRSRGGLRPSEYSSPVPTSTAEPRIQLVEIVPIGGPFGVFSSDHPTPVQLSPNLLQTVASIGELDPSDYEKTWILRDAADRTPLFKGTLSNFGTYEGSRALVLERLQRPLR